MPWGHQSTRGEESPMGPRSWSLEKHQEYRPAPRHRHGRGIARSGAGRQQIEGDEATVTQRPFGRLLVWECSSGDVGKRQVPGCAASWTRRVEQRPSCALAWPASAAGLGRPGGTDPPGRAPALGIVGSRTPGPCLRRTARSVAECPGSAAALLGLVVGSEFDGVG